MDRIETAEWGFDNIPPAPGDTLENVRTGELLRLWLAVWRRGGWTIYVDR